MTSNGSSSASAASLMTANNKENSNASIEASLLATPNHHNHSNLPYNNSSNSNLHGTLLKCKTPIPTTNSSSSSSSSSASVRGSLPPPIASVRGSAKASLLAAESVLASTGHHHHHHHHGSSSVNWDANGLSGLRSPLRALAGRHSGSLLSMTTASTATSSLAGQHQFRHHSCRNEDHHNDDDPACHFMSPMHCTPDVIDDGCSGSNDCLSTEQGIADDNVFGRSMSNSKARTTNSHNDYSADSQGIINCDDDEEAVISDPFRLVSLLYCRLYFSASLSFPLLPWSTSSEWSLVDILFISC